MTVIEDRHSSAPECSMDLLVLGLIAFVVIHVWFYIIWRRTTRQMPTSHLAGLQMQLCAVRQEELKIQTDSSSIYVIIVLASPLFSLITIYLKLVANFESVYMRIVASPFPHCSLNYQLKFCFMHLISDTTMFSALAVFPPTETLWLKILNVVKSNKEK